MKYWVVQAILNAKTWSILHFFKKGITKKVGGMAQAIPVASHLTSNSKAVCIENPMGLLWIDCDLKAKKHGSTWSGWPKLAQFHQILKALQGQWWLAHEWTNDHRRSPGLLLRGRQCQTLSIHPDHSNERQETLG